MLLIPYDSFTVESQDAIPALVERLRSQVGPPGSSMRGEFCFEGEVWDNGFSVSNVWGRGRATVQLILRGRFESTTGGGTRVRVTVRPEAFELAFLFGTFVMAVLSIVQWSASFIPFVVFACGWAIVNSRWRSRAPKCRDAMTTMINGAARNATGTTGAGAGESNLENSQVPRDR